MTEFFATDAKPSDRVERLTAIAAREHREAGALLETRFRENVRGSR